MFFKPLFWLPFSLITLHFTGQFFDFALGIIGGLFVLQYPQSGWINGKRFNTLLGIAGMAMFCMMVFLCGKQPDIWFHSNKSIGFLLTLACGISAILIILSLYGNSWLRKAFENKAVVYGGKISFAFYLIHFHIIIYLKNPLLSVIASITSGQIHGLSAMLLAAIIIFLITGLLSALIYEQIEMPVQTYLRSRWLQGKRYQTKPTF